MTMSYLEPRPHFTCRQEPLLRFYCSRLSWHLGSFHYCSNCQVLHLISTRPQTLHHPAPASCAAPPAPPPPPLAWLSTAHQCRCAEWRCCPVVSSTDWTTLVRHWSWASQLSPQSPSPYLVKFENGFLRMELTSTGDSTLRRPGSGVLTSPNLPHTEFSRFS